jgi:hypothetical protein
MTYETLLTETGICDAMEEAGFVGVKLIHPNKCMNGLMEGFKPR